MGFVREHTGLDLTGGGARDAAEDAADRQVESADRAIDLQRETRDIARGDLQQFRDFGGGQINALNQLLTSQGQADFIQNNPLVQLSVNEANEATLKNQAARGKLGSGSTLQSLSDNQLAASLPILQNQQNQLFNAINLGQSSAAGQANTSLQTGNSLSNLFTQQGNAQAAGIVGGFNGQQQTLQNTLGAFGSAFGSSSQSGGGGGGLGGLAGAASFASAFCDARIKDIGKKVATLSNGVELYEASYKGESLVRIMPIAQQVEEVLPEAVFEFNGIKMIDLEVLRAA